MRKHRTQVMLDEDLYQGLKKLPREISVSAVINLLLKSAIKEIQMLRDETSSHYEVAVQYAAERSDIKRLLQDSIGPYVDLVCETMAKVNAKTTGKKK